jgi:PadR family transcriptional regulator, regulatory protein PadR
MARKTDRLAVLRGTLDVLVLQSLSARRRHGFEIALWLEEGSGETLDIDDSALYQALHRLEARGLIRGEWGVSENNRRAKFYTLTADGRAQLSTERKRIMSFAKTITAMLGPGRTR